MRPNATDLRGRSVDEQMVHQCVSEDLWFRNMLAIDVGAPPLPAQETRMEFIQRYADDSGKRLAALQAKQEQWWEEKVKFFGVATARLDHGAQDSAHVSSSRAVDGHAADARPRHPQQLRADG